MRVNPNPKHQGCLLHPKKTYSSGRAALLMSLLCIAGARQLFAAEAIISYAGFPSAGYAYGGAGFAFTPLTDIAVTSLGFGGAMLTSGACKVAVWDSNGQEPASVIVTTNSAPVHWASYEAIPPLILLAGETYYVQSIRPSDGRWVGNAVLNVALSLGPNITYLSSVMGTNSQGVFPRTSGPPNDLIVGPNFLYQTPPFTLITGLAVTPGAVSLTLLTGSTSSPSLTLLEADQPAGPWRTNLSAVLATNVPGRSYTITAPTEGNARFYSVQTP